MKKLLLCVLAIFCFFTASEAKEESTLVYVNFRDIRDLNPHLYGGEMYAQNLLYESLVKITGNGIEPWLAEKWDVSDDGKVYTGCRVENAAAGLSMCACRNAIFHAVTHPAETAHRVVNKLVHMKDALVDMLPDMPWSGHQRTEPHSSMASVGMASALVVLSPFSAPLALSNFVMDKLTELHLPKLAVAHVDHPPTRPSATPLVLVSQHPDTTPYLPFLTRS